MSLVCILDYGSGNVKSVFNLFTAITPDVVISNEVGDINRASHIVLPGVGAFGAAMRKMGERLPLSVLERMVLQERRPFLGICVGMQVLATKGFEFGEFAGLSWISGEVDKVAAGDLPLPHIGWNNVTAARESPLLAGLGPSPDFYFVHTYALRPQDPRDAVATTSYGEDFCSIVQRDNVFGVQFHPEKSQQAGIRLVKNFMAVA